MKPRDIAIQHTAQFTAEAWAAFRNPRDGAAAMALAVTANIWTQARPQTEDEVREIMARLTETVVDCWKKQIEFVRGQGNDSKEIRAPDHRGEGGTA